MTTGSVPNPIAMARDDAPVDLDRVYREHAARVSGWVRRLTGTNDVSDTLQEVFEVAQRRLASFRGDAQITTWLYAITVRVVSARRRKARIRRLLFAQAQTEVDVSAAPFETPADALHRRQATQVVYSVLDGLSERDRSLLILFELERLGITEIGVILGMSENNVSVSLHRARERFRKRHRQLFPKEREGTNHGQASR